jgi:Flp pilus assembly protein TadD
MENIKLLFQLYVRPAFAMSELIDRGSWFVALLLMFVASTAFYLTVNAKLQTAYSVPEFYEYYNPDFAAVEEDSPAARAALEKATAAYRSAMDARRTIPVIGDRFFRFFNFEPSGFFQPLISLSIFYVPAVILLVSIFAHLGRFGLILQRDYGTLATCSMTAWTAAVLPFAIAGILLYGQPVAPEIYLAMWAASAVLFGLLMVFAIRTVFGANYGTAVLVVLLAWLAFTLGMYVSRFVSPWLLSPFLLFYGYLYFGGALRGEVRGFGNAFRQRQNFKRFLHNATINPKDSDAHVQLALVYLQRRQEAKALEHLGQALAIDPQEIDANYELGKIARRKGDLSKAIEHFSVVVEQNDKYALSEIWREIGSTYLEAGMHREAREALEKYVERRAFDSEGLYYLGKVYNALQEPDKAREMFEQAIEVVKTSPSHRRYELKYWSKLAQKEL